MSANGGQIPASRQQGVERTGDTPNYQHGGGGGRFARVVIPQEGSPRGSRARIYDESLSEFRAHTAWARGQAGRFFTVACVLPLIELLLFGLLVALANATNSPAAELLKLISANKLLTITAAMFPSGFLTYAGFTILNHISRTHDEMTTADSKRGAAFLPLAPASVEHLSSVLCGVDRNPKLVPGETLADIERQRQTIRPYLAFFRDIVIGWIGRGSRARNAGGGVNTPEQKTGTRRR